MKIITSIFTCVTLLAFQSATAEQPQLSDLSSLSTSSHNSDRDIRRAPVWEITTQSKVKKSKSKLEVSDAGICLTTNTTIVPGVNTTWWMVFNEPSECSNPNPFGNGQKCGIPDLNNPLTRGTLMWAGPLVVGPNQDANMNFCLNVGELTHAVFPLGTQEGIVSPHQAEYQLFIRTHGPGAFGDAQLLGEQLNSFNGGCQTDDQAGFQCETLQILYHPAP